MSGLIRKVTVLLFFVSLLIFLGACSNESSQAVSDKDADVIEAYLDQKVLSPIFGGKVFSAYRVMGSNPGKVYIWALLQEYYKKGDQIERGTGWSVPLVLSIEEGSDGMIVSGHQYPGDGTKFSVDVKSLFPRDLQQTVFKFPTTQRSRDLENTTKSRAQQWSTQ